MKVIKWNQRTITKPGLYADIPLLVYHERFDRTTGELTKLCDKYSLSSSGLRTIFIDSPADFWCYSPYNPGGIEQEDKSHFVLGRALHHLLLGQPFFAREFAIRPKEFDSWRTKASQDWRKEQAALGKTALTPDQVDHIKGMAQTVGKNDLFRAGILNGLVEHTMIGVDENTGYYLKSRPDAIPTDSGDYGDLKITTSVQLPDITRTIYEYGYHQQAALTRMVSEQVLGVRMSSYSLFFVQHTPPYSCRVVQLKPHDMDRGDKQNRYAIDTFARCIKSGHWPGPGGERADAEYVELPEWAGKSIDDRLEYLQANQPKE